MNGKGEMVDSRKGRRISGLSVQFPSTLFPGKIADSFENILSVVFGVLSEKVHGDVKSVGSREGRVMKF